MYTLLVVDDEPLIADGIYDIFKYDKELELKVYKAYSAVSAVHIIESVKIDILLSDIKMPGMTGLQLAEEVLKKWPVCRLVFLTAYNNFDYIYAAVKHPNVKYVLKDEEDEVIKKAVIDSMKSIEEELNQEKVVVQANDDIQQALPLIKDKILRGLVARDQFCIDRIHAFSRYNINLSTSDPLIMVIAQSNLKYTKDEFEDIINLHFSGCLQYEVCTYIPNIFIVYFQNRNTESASTNASPQLEGVLGFIKNKCQDIHASLLERKRISLSFVISGTPIQWECLPQAFDNLSNYFEAGLKQTLVVYNDDNGLSDTIKYRRQAELIDMINRFVAENVDKELSLVSIAGTFFINPSYLSRLYKQLTRKNLSDYVKDIKLQKAKELLATSNKSIHTIAAEVGFESSSAFIFFFKKYINQTPLQFRNNSSNI